MPCLWSDSQSVIAENCHRVWVWFKLGAFYETKSTTKLQFRIYSERKTGVIVISAFLCLKSQVCTTSNLKHWKITRLKVSLWGDIHCNQTSAWLKITLRARFSRFCMIDSTQTSWPSLEILTWKSPENFLWITTLVVCLSKIGDITFCQLYASKFMHNSRPQLWVLTGRTKSFEFKKVGS